MPCFICFKVLQKMCLKQKSIIESDLNILVSQVTTLDSGFKIKLGTHQAGILLQIIFNIYRRTTASLPKVH